MRFNHNVNVNIEFQINQEHIWCPVEMCESNSEGIFRKKSLKFFLKSCLNSIFIRQRFLLKLNRTYIIMDSKIKRRKLIWTHLGNNSNSLQEGVLINLIFILYLLLRRAI